MKPEIKPYKGYESPLAYYTAHPELHGKGRTQLMREHSGVAQALYRAKQMEEAIPFKKRTSNPVSQSQIEEIVTAHPIYDGNPYYASKHLPYAPTTFIKYWTKHGLPVHRRVRSSFKKFMERRRHHQRNVVAPSKYVHIPRHPISQERIDGVVEEGKTSPQITKKPSKFLDIEEIIAQQNPLIIRQYKTIQAYLDVKTIVNYVVKHGKPVEIPENEKRPSLSWDLIMEEGSEQTMYERLFPQLAELAKSNQQLVLELPNFADTPLQLRHDWLFTDSLRMEDYKINISGGKNSRSVVIWKNDKRQFMINVFLVRTSDYELGRGIFDSVYAYFPGTERLPLFGFNDLEVQGNFHDATTLDDVLQRLSRLAEVIRRNRVPPLDKPNFVDGEFKN